MRKRNSQAQRSTRRDWNWSLPTLLFSVLCFGGCSDSKTGIFNESPELLLQNVSSESPRFRQEYEARIEAVQKNPDSKDALAELSLFYHANGRAEPAQVLYGRLSETFPDDPIWPYLMALVYQDRGQNAEAINFFEKALRRDPDYVTAYLNLGDCYKKTGRSDAAAKVFGQCLEYSPENPYALIGLARIALQKGDLPTAQQLLVRSIQSETELLTSFMLLATVYDQMGKTDLAEQARKLGEKKNRYYEPEDKRLDAVTEHCFDVYRLSVLADMYLNTGRAARALGLLIRALEIEPDNARTHLELAKAHLQLNQPAQAIPLLQKAVRLDKAIEDAHYLLVSELETSGQIQAALSASQAGISANPQSAGLWRQQGVLLENQRQYPETEAAYRRAVELDPNDTRNLETLANYYWARGMKGQGLPLYEQTVALSRNTVKARAVLAAHFLETNELQKAQTLAWQAYQTDSSLEGIAELCALTSLRTGNAFFRNAQTDKAEAAYLQSLKAIPDGREAMTNLVTLYIKTGHAAKAQSLLVYFLQSHSDKTFAYPLAAVAELELNFKEKAMEYLQTGKRLAIATNDREQQAIIDRLIQANR